MNPDALIALKILDTAPCVKVSENNPCFSPIPLMVLGFRSDTAAVWIGKITPEILRTLVWA